MGKWIGYAVLVLVAIFVIKWALATLGGLASAIVPSGSGGAMTISPLLWIIIVVGLIVAGLWMLARGVAGGTACLIIAGLIWLLLMGGLQSLINNLHGIHWPTPTAGGIPPMGAPSPSATPAPGTSAVPSSIPRLGPSPIGGIDWADILVGLLAIYLVIRIIRGLFGGAAAAAPAARASMSTGRTIFWLVVLAFVVWYSYAAFPGVRRGMNTLATAGNQTAGAILAPALSDKFNAFTGLYQRQGEWMAYKLDLDEPPPAFGDMWLKFVLPQTSVVRKFEVEINGRIYKAVQMPFPGPCQISIAPQQLRGATSVTVKLRGLNGWKIPAPLGPMTLYQR